MRSKIFVAAVAAICGLATSTPAASRRFSDAMEAKILLTSGGLASWDIRNDYGTSPGTPTGTCNLGTPGLAVFDATLDPGGENRGDALDGAFVLWVNDQRFVAPDTVDVTDQRLTAGPVSLAGLEVTVEYLALQSRPTLRALVTFENTTDVPFEGTVVLGSNFGSDSLTDLRGAALDGESWQVTSDSATAPDDPAILMVAHGPEPFFTRGLFTISSPSGFTGLGETFQCTGRDGRQISATLFVPPRQTVRLLQFVGLASSNADAVVAGERFDSNPTVDSELMAGITAEQSLSIINWSFFATAELTGGGASWFFSGLNGTSNGRPAGGKCGALPGIGLLDAAPTTPLKFESFNRGLLVFVDEVPLPITTPVSEDDGVVRVGPAILSGLEVMVTHTALETSPTLRTLVSLRNPSAAVVSTKVVLASNFGSNERNVVRSTSDGDGTITSDDRWAITSDDQVPPAADPVSTHVVAGPGAPTVRPAIATDVFECFGGPPANGLRATYELSLAPGQTQSLLLYNQVHTLVADATDDVTVFDTTPQLGGPLLAGFSLEPRLAASVVNWNLCRGATHDEAVCRASGLEDDTLASGDVGPVRGKLVALVGTANDAIRDAAVASCTGNKRASKRALKMADAALKGFAKLLKSKKAKAIIAEPARTRLRAVATELRATVRRLATTTTIPLVC